jgi:hypothetical protein
MLWFMRRPLIKRMRRNAPNLLPERKRAAAWENIKAQDRWAMKHGQSMIRFSLNVFFASCFVTAVYMALLRAQEIGLLREASNQVR